MDCQKDNIEVLSTIDHIRLKPGMYIGDLYYYGIWTIIYNTTIQFFEKSKDGFYIEIITNRNRIKLIYVFNNTKYFYSNIHRINIIEYFSTTIGIPLVIALSKECIIKADFGNKTALVISENGNLGIPVYNTGTESRNKVALDFKIDDSILRSKEINFDYLCQKIQQIAYTANNCTFVCRDMPTKQSRKFIYKNGLADLFDYQLKKDFYKYEYKNLFFKTVIDEYEYEICICLNGGKYGKDNFTFANHFHTTLGGSLENSIQKGIIKAINKWTLLNFNKSAFKYHISKIEYLKNTLFIVAGIKGNQLTFYGPTKETLGMPEIEKKLTQYIYKKVLEYLNFEKESSIKLLKTLYIIY
ncbi:MAG TPA: hypothetical protein PKO18_00430 [Chitinophagales bacterium]|nr:hypothetical protein [Chitinophagales bacterium]HNL83667.1 hypothetical protein [Chitinophagales bacterium]